MFGSFTAAWFQDFLIEDCIFDGTDRRWSVFTNYHDKARLTKAATEFSYPKVTTDPAGGVIAGKERPDCEGRPSQIGIRVQTSGAVVAMTATGSLPDGFGQFTGRR